MPKICNLCLLFLEMVDQMKGQEYDKMIYYYNYYINSTTFEVRTLEMYNQEISEAIAEEQFPEYDQEVKFCFLDFHKTCVLKV